MKKSSFFLLLFAFSALGETQAILNVRILPVTAAPIERGTLLIKDGKIAALGVKVALPPGTVKIDGTGLTVYPGLVDAYTSIGMSEISSVRGSVDTNEIGPYNPQVQSWIAVNPHSEMLRTARVNGITSALVAPGGNAVAGTAAAIDLFGKYPDQMLLRRVGVVINVPSIYRRTGRDFEALVAGPPDPENRRQRVAEEIARLKQFLREAKAYAALKSVSVRHAALEAMAPVMRGEVAAICPADHFRDIRAAVELGQEFGLKVIIAGGAEAAKVAALLKEKNVPVLYGAVNSLPRQQEDTYDVNFATPEALRRAGVRFAIVTGGGGGMGAGGAEARNLPYMAAMSAAFGLEREDALRAITLWPAELLGIADRVGSLETGKLANLLVTKGDPLDIRSEVKYVFIEGKQVPLESRNTELYEKFVE
ncbi:MAG: amidohydrolase family protein [Acidobacteria bacterium]|nr:amidohydrolase family protein [Acidobacteriota bacterium]